MIAVNSILLITVKSSSIHSNGVFANVDIAKGARIIEYVGEKITKKEAGLRVDASIDNHRKNQSDGAVYIFELNKRYDIDGNVPYNHARHINHSCDPNAETEIIRGKIWIMAIKDIRQGEEITYNYGYDFDLDYVDHPCRCASARCIGYILGEEHWPKLSEHQAKKSGHSGSLKELVKMQCVLILCALFVFSVDVEAQQDTSQRNNSCQHNSDCHLVSSVVSSGDGGMQKTLIRCAHKEDALKQGEWLQEYNEYTKSQCICDQEEQRCELKP